MKIERETWILIIAGIALLSFILSFAQGWFKVQLMYFVILILVTVIVAAIFYKREKKKFDIIAAKEIGENTLRQLDPNAVSGSGGKLDWISKHSDNKRFSGRGKIWDMQFTTTPSKAVIQLDPRSGDVLNAALSTKSRDPPFFASFDADLGQYDTGRRRYKRKKTDTTTEIRT